MVNLELKLQTPTVNGIDVNNSELAKDFAALKQKFGQEFDAIKAKVEQSKTLDEAKKFLGKMPVLYADAGSLTLKFGDSYIQAPDQATFETYQKDMQAQLDEMNKQLLAYEQKMNAEKDETKDDSQKQLDEVKKNVTIEEKNLDGITFEYFRDTGISVFTLDNWIQLTQKRQGDAGSSFMIDPASNLQSAQGRRLERRVNRHMDIQNEKRKARKLEKDVKKADKLRDNVARQRDAMAQIGGDVMNAAENRKQTLYYEQVVHLAIQEFKKGKYNADDTVYIETYNPLFIVEGLNPSGKVGLKLTPDQILAYEQENQLIYDPITKLERPRTPAEQAYFKAHPEDANNPGGLSGALANAIMEHSNMTAKQGATLKSALKIGTLIGLGVLGWKTIKKIFNIGGKNKPGDGWKWGLGAAAVLIGVPALTGQNILELLTTGDSKDAWNKTKNLFKKMGIEIGSFFSSTNKEAINPAIGNMLFGSMTVGEARRYFDYKDGKYTLDQNKFGEYLAEQAQKETDPVKKKALQDKLAIYKKMLAEKQLGEVGNDWGNTIGLNEVADTGKTTQELYEAYIEGLSLGAGLLEGDTKLRIKDKDAFNKYIREQIIDKKRNPSDITKKDLLDAGLLEEIPETTDTNNQNQDQNQNNPNNGNNNAPNAAPDVEPGTWEKITNWTADKWGKFKDGVKSTSKTVGAFAASVYTGEIFHRNDSEKLKRLRESLNTAKETLKELKKQNAIMTDLAIKETDIHLLELEIEETESQIIKMGAMMADELDPTLVPADTTLLTWLSSENKKEMTRGIRKINFLIKFQSPNDECRFILEGDKLFVQSCGDKTQIRHSADGNYFLEGFNVPFTDAESVIRMANLTNFLKVNFANRATTNVDAPWLIANDGDLTLKDQTVWDAVKKGDLKGMIFNTAVLDGEDGFSSAITEMGGATFESRKAEYAQYLNQMKTPGGKSLWAAKENTEMTPEALATIERVMKSELHVIKAGTLYRPERPDDYPGKETIHDQNAKLETIEGHLTLKSHNQKINIIPSKTEEGWYQIGYVKSIDKDGKLQGSFLDLNFSPAEAIKMGNLINFYKQVYAGYGTSNKSFNISALGGDLEFAEDGIMDWIDIDALPNGVAVEQYAKTFGNARSMSILCDWLNSMDIWEAK